MKGILSALAILCSLSASAQSVNAGYDWKFYAPHNEHTLIATYSGYTPTTWAWTQISGPACTIADNNKRVAVARGMDAAGVYVFRVTGNGTYTDEIQVTVLANGSGNQWILQDNNEDGTFTTSSSPFSGFWTYKEWGYDTISALTVSTEQASSGTYSYKMTLKRAQPAQSNGLSYRVEQYPFIMSGTANNVVPTWAGWDVYLKDHISEAAPEIIGQEHHTQSSGSTGAPPIAIWVKNNKFYASIGYDTTTSNVAYNAGSGASVSRTAAAGSNAEGLIYLGEATPNTWHKFVRYTNFSATDTGKVKIWINGQLALDYTGPCWYKEPFVYPISGHKFGLYKWPWGPSWQDAWGQRTATQRTIYIDNLRYANRLATAADMGISAANTPPVANAGNDTTITAPQSWAYLRGWASTDPDGTISSYSWSNVSGPSAGSIMNPNQAQTTAGALIPGVYVFSLTVADDQGAVDSDEMTITVNPAPANVAPVANAGADIKVFEGVTSIQLNGSGTDSDGTIAKYGWRLLYGEPLQFSDDSINNPIITNLAPGKYLIQLTVIDNDGAADTDELWLEVVRRKLPRKPRRQQY